MGWLSLGVRVGVFTLCLAAICVLAFGLSITDLAKGKTIDRAPWAHTCFRWVCRCLGLRIHQHGHPATEPALFASNHISWLDIPVLGSLVQTRFLAKNEVRQWPVIGWLAEQGGTLFIRRGGGQARRVRARITDSLKAKENVLIYPEGTTSAGLTVLPFHGLLLQAAKKAGTPVQPITLAYRREGRPDHLTPFIGDDGFPWHLLRMLRHSAARVDVVFHDPVYATANTTTAEFAARLQEIVRSGLKNVYSGEFDSDKVRRVRTVAGPGLSHLPSLHDGRQSPDQSTG